jgi:hypothetical protein
VGYDSALDGSPDCIAVGDRVVAGIVTAGTRVGELERRLLGIVSDGVSDGVSEGVSDVRLVCSLAGMMIRPIRQ